MPERGAHHVLNGTLFAVSQLHSCLRLLFADTWALTANLARLVRTLTRCFSTHWTRLRRWLYTLAGVIATLQARFRFQRLAVPLRIAEMVVRLHEVVDGEIILAIVEPRAAPNDLFELDHGVDGAHQDDVADVPGIHAGRELLRGGQNGRNGLFVVLKDHSDHFDHLAKALDRRGCPEHPQHRPDAPHQLHDRVQTNHWARHAALRWQGLFHHLRLREGVPPFQRSGVGRRAAGTGTVPEVWLSPLPMCKAIAATVSSVWKNTL